MKYFIFSCLFTFYLFGLSAQPRQKKLTYEELNNRINEVEENGNLEDALIYAKQGMEQAKQEFGESDSTYISFLFLVGYFYSKTYKYEEAVQYLLKAKHLKDKINQTDDDNYSEILTNLSSIYISLGNIEQSERYALAHKMMTEQQGNQTNHAMSLNNLAQVYQDMGDYMQAELLMHEALLLYASSIGKSSVPYSIILDNLAMLYLDINKPDKAIPLLLQSMEINENLYKKDLKQYSTTIFNLADAYISAEDYHKALPLLLTLYQINKKNNTENSPEYAITLKQLAKVYIFLEQYDFAEQILQQSEKLCLTQFDKTHMRFISTQSLFVMLYIAQGKNDLAWQYLQIVLQQSTELPISINISDSWADSLLNANYKSPEILAETISILEYAYNLTTGKHKKLIICNVVMQLIKISRDQLVNDADKLRILTESQKWLQKTLHTLDPKTEIEKAFIAAQFNKSVLLLQSTNRLTAQANTGLPQKYFEQETMLYNKRAQLEAQMQENIAKPQKDSIRSALNELNIEIKALKKDIEKQYPEYAKFKNQQKEINISDIQATLDHKSAFIEYVVTDNHIYIFYIDQQKSYLTTVDIPHDSLVKKVTNFHRSLSEYSYINEYPEQAYTDYTTTAYWFYLNTLAPVLAQNPNKNIKHLTIIPDAELGYLPFEAFLTKPAPTNTLNYTNLPYLLHDFSISYNHSTALNFLSTQQHNEAKHNKQILAMAAEYLPKNVTSNSFNRSPSKYNLRKILAHLPAAKQEVKNLQTIFEGEFVFDSTASERFFKQKSADFAVIHLAMHGLLDPQQPVLSSLAFTENGDSLHDNFLHAFEISQMKLNAQLVVLSACETGYGKVEAGNGIASLARSFIYAGAPALLVSLWAVNDLSTATIMNNFYANIANHTNKDEALRQAKIKYLQQAQGVAAHPAFWSAFVQIGNTKPIHINLKNNPKTLILYIGIALALVSAAVFFIRAKRQPKAA